jgi:transcription initiation factor TFIIIB Brf1 subunit/transcription initiation factor TFIIB
VNCAYCGSKEVFRDREYVNWECGNVWSCYVGITRSEECKRREDARTDRQKTTSTT